MEIKENPYERKEALEELYYTTTTTSPFVKRGALEEYEKAKAAWEKEIERMKPSAIWTMPTAVDRLLPAKSIDGWLTFLHELDNQNRENLLNAILIFLENNK